MLFEGASEVKLISLTSITVKVTSLDSTPSQIAFTLTVCPAAVPLLIVNTPVVVTDAYSLPAVIT